MDKFSTQIIENNLNPEDLTFLVGCGISFNWPTCLPLGERLTKFILERACGEGSADRIISLWAIINDETRKLNAQFDYPILRLETLLNVLNEIDENENRTPILNGLESFADRMPNDAHSCLAYFLSMGSNILTVNFDRGIEYAFEKEPCYGNLSELIFDSSVPYCRTKKNSIIIHLHGDAGNIRSAPLGATMKQIKKGFSDQTKINVESILDRTKALIVIGYSASDSYDITPFMQQYMPNKDSHLYFINHQSQMIPPAPIHENILKKIHAFGKNYGNRLEIITADTTAILSALASHYGYSKPPVLNSFSPDWEVSFCEHWNSIYDEEEKCINNAAMRFHIGYNPTLIDPDIKAKISIITENRIILGRKTKLYLKEALNHAIGNEDEPNITNPIRFLDAIKRDVLLKMKGDVHSAAYLHNLFIISNYYLNKYLDPNASISISDKSGIRKTMDDLNRCAELGYSQFDYLSNLATCLRYQVLFKSRFEHNFDSSLLLKEMQLNLDMTYAEGVIRAIRDQIHYNIYRLNSDATIGKQDVLTLKDDIVRYAQCGQNISKATGFNTHNIHFLKILQFSPENIDLYELRPCFGALL